MCMHCGGILEMGLLASAVTTISWCWTCFKAKIFKKHQNNCECECHDHDGN